MRPRRLELTGFTAFRDKTVIDFEGAELFALVGPTGAGKSSIIDAIVFALYGAVPRTGKGAVEPVVSLGKIETRVRFDFTIGKVDYTAVRVVRRTKTGATTAEARLERDGEVVAGNADEVTEQVEHLIGLGFAHFTKCVVLPQGEFATFLHDPPGERQKLLRELLDLSVYERMRDLANHRKAAAEGAVATLTAQLEGMREATPEALEAARKRLAALIALQEEIERAQPELDELIAGASQHEVEAATAEEQVKLVAVVRTPDGVDELAARLDLAVEAETRLTEAAVEAAAAVEDLERRLASLPEPSGVDRLLEAHQRLAAETASSSRLAEAAVAAATTAASAAEDLEAARANEEAARSALEALQRTHAAHVLAATLVVGEPCPVCRRTVEAVPDLPRPAAVEDAERVLEGARRANKEAAARAADAGNRLAVADKQAEEAVERVVQLREVVAAGPPLDELEESRRALAGLGEEIKEAKAAEQKARRTLQAAATGRAGAEQQVQDARRFFDRTRDRVAALGPPVAERRDLAADWRQLTIWAAGMVRGRVEAAERARREAAEARRLAEERQASLAAGLVAAGLKIDGAVLRDVCVAAVAQTTGAVQRLEEALKTAAGVAVEIEQLRKEAAVAQALARHLSAMGFEAWLLEEALGALVEGANRMLDDLTDRAYALRLVKRDFRVVDHRNADETRPVKTLSGGETFLVSLALALALADQLASMSVHGGAPLESIFLDEGFGTLDAETLDTVAGVIQELGSRGRTVGIVTHVRELADQMPVQYVVRREPATATVTREEAS